MSTKVYNSGEWKIADNAVVDSYGKTESDAKYYPYTGGEMLGQIIAQSNENGSIRGKDHTGVISILGGNNQNQGSYLRLYALDHPWGSGRFVLTSTDGLSHYELQGNNLGKLTWAGKEVATKKVADKNWTLLTNVGATAGYVRWCCKNDIVFVEGSFLAIAAGSNVIAEGIPEDYRPSVESYGTLLTDYGSTFVGMCWIQIDNGQIKCQSLSTEISGSEGRLHISWPVV